MKYLLLGVLGLSVMACESAPTAPTRITSTADASQKAVVYAGYGFDPTQLGHAWVVKPAPEDTYTLVVWDATDDVNQVFVAQGHSTPTGDMTLGMTVDPCIRYQRDIYKNLPTADRHTLSGAADYLYAAPGAFWGPSEHCRVSPPSAPPIGPPTPPVAPPAPPVPPVEPPTPPKPPIPPLPPVEQCLGGGSFDFPSDSYVAKFPAGYPMPWYPETLPPLMVNIPRGTWMLVVKTGDNHSGKLNEYPQPQFPAGFDPQQHESVSLSGNGASLGQTLDVPANRDTQITVLGPVTLTSPITGIVATTAGQTFVWDGVEQPNDSVKIISISYACPR